jgi:chromosome segregation ATPase
MQELDISDVRRSHYDSPEANRVTWKGKEEAKSFIPVYTADPLLLKQLENDKKSLKEELLKTQDKFELQLRKKNEEVKRMQKQNEELMAKLDLAEETERKFASLKAERDAQERKVHALEGECDNYKRQIEHLKEACESYKSQIDDYERASRNKCQDVERELRIAKDRIEDLERQVTREKERQQHRTQAQQVKRKSF